jgi:hypothetical protein
LHILSVFTFTLVGEGRILYAKNEDKKHIKIK